MYPRCYIDVQTNRICDSPFYLHSDGWVLHVDNGVGWCDGQDGEVVMTKVDSVGDAEGLDFCIDDAMALVMLKGRC